MPKGHKRKHPGFERGDIHHLAGRFQHTFDEPFDEGREEKITRLPREIYDMAFDDKTVRF